MGGGARVTGRARGGCLGTEGGGGEGRRKRGPRDRAGSDLVHLRPVLQATAEGVPGEAGNDHEQRVQAAEDGSQHYGFGQPGVGGDVGQALPQGGQVLPLVQHSCNSRHQNRPRESRCDPCPAGPAMLTDLLEQDHSLVHCLDVRTVHGLRKELHCLRQEPAKAHREPGSCPRLPVPSLRPAPRLAHRLLGHVDFGL